MSTATYSEYGIVVPSSEGTSSVSGTEYVQYTGNTSGATCDANTGNWQGGTQSYHNMYIETGGWCVFPVLKYDISSALPSGKYAKSIEMEMPISLANSGNTGCSLYDISIDPATTYQDNQSPQDMVEDMLSGNKYVTDDNFCTSTGTKTITLNQQAVDDFNTALQNGQSWFAVGFYFDDLTKDALSSHKRVTYSSGSTNLNIDYGSGS